MEGSEPRQVLSRLPGSEFLDRQSELERICSAEQTSRGALILGPPRAGKSELLRKAFDRLFSERSKLVPIYYSFSADRLSINAFARDYTARFLAQFIAFRRGDARLIAFGSDSLEALAREALPEDYLWVRGAVDALTRANDSMDSSVRLDRAVSIPTIAAGGTWLAPLVMLDNIHLLWETARESPIWSAISRAIAGEFGFAGSIAPRYMLSGQRRSLLEVIPAGDELFSQLDVIAVEPLANEHIERLLRLLASKAGVDLSDSTAELVLQQLSGDAFYTRNLVAAAASRGSNLKSFMDFERLYTEEVTNGKLCHYFDAVIRGIASSHGLRRAALELLALVFESESRISREIALQRLGDLNGVEELLARLHGRELITLTLGFVQKSEDPVLADYVRVKYRNEIAGAGRPLAGSVLLGEKLKDSYGLMMSRYNRAVESQLLEILIRFDFQSVPSTLFDCSSFDKSFRGMGRAGVRRTIESHADRLRLPQIVVVADVGSEDQGGTNWRLFVATGFEGGIYSDASEVRWAIALINSKEPVDLETLREIDIRLDAALHEARRLGGRTSLPPGRAIRWHISKEGFSAAALQRLSELGIHTSTFVQLDLLHDWLERMAVEGRDVRRATEFELVIPMEDEAELIAARTVEQIARTIDFDQQSINQIKTALIEACINAAEHGDSPDRRIYQKFELTDSTLSITVSNKGNPFGLPDGKPAAGTPAKNRGRGLQIIRALMDEVRFERSDDGTNLVMVKHLRQPDI